MINKLRETRDDSSNSHLVNSVNPVYFRAFLFLGFSFSTL